MRRNLLPALLLIAATFIVFAPVAQHDYINLDDQAYVPENPHINKGLTLDGVRWAFTTHHGGSWHPVTWLSHMLDVQWFGLKAGPQHLMSVGIHAVSAALLFLALFLMTQARWESLAVAALFALHPLRVESVAWVAERKDVLSGFWFMVVLLAYAKFGLESKAQTLSAAASATKNPKARFWYGATLIAFVLGLMSKPMLVSVPFVLLLLDFWPLQRVRDGEGRAAAGRLRGLMVEKVPFFVIALVFCGLTLRSQDDVGAVVSVEHVSPLVRVVNALNSLVMYTANTIWPKGLNPFYAFDPITPGWTALLLIAVGGATVVAIWFARRRPFLLTGWFWYVVMLGPVLGLVQVGSQARADRYTYLPGIGLLLALVWVASSLLPRNRSVRAGLGLATLAALVGLGLATRHQLQFWKDAIVYCQRSVTIEPRDARSHFNLGCTLEKMGDRDGAIKHFEAAIATSAAYTKAHNNLGSALAGKGDFAGAELHFREALMLNTNHTSARMNLARALLSQRKVAEAVAVLQAAPEKDRALPALQAMTGDLLLQLGRVREAVPYFEQLLKADPVAELQAKIAGLRIQLNEPKAALEHFRTAVKLKPDWVEVLNNLAWTLATNPDPAVRNGAEAVGYAERACELTQRGQPVFLITLAAAYAEAGQFEQAKSTSQQAMQLAIQSGNTQLVTSLTPLHSAFQNRQPYHTPPPATAN